MKSKKPLKLFSIIFVVIMLLTVSFNMLGCGTATEEVVYTYGSSSLPRTQNPFVADMDQDQLSMVQVYEPLFIDLGMYIERVPLIAKSWEWNETDVSYTFHLDPRAKFSDGTAVTAEDVKYSFETAMYVANQHPALQEIIESIEVIDTRTVKFNLVEPNLLFMQGVSVVHIVPKHIWSEIDNIMEYLNENPVGSGPYFWTEYHFDTHCTFVRNPNYWRGAGQITKVILKGIETSEGMMMALLRGDTQALGTDVLKSAIPQLIMDPNIAVNLVAGSSGNVMYLNLRIEPLNLRKFRQAMDIVINRSALIQNVHQGYGMMPQQVPVAQSEPHHHPDLAWPYADMTQAERVTMANARLDEIADMSKTPSPIPDGWVRTYKGNPVNLDFITSTSIHTVEMSSQIVSDLATVGLKFNHKPQSFGAAYATVFRHEGENPLGWDAFFCPHFGISGFRESWRYPAPAPLEEGGYWRPKLYGSETAGYNNPAFHALLDQALTEMDTDARKALDYQWQELYAADLPQIVLHHSLEAYTYRTDMFTGWLMETKGVGDVLYGGYPIPQGIAPLNTVNLRLKT